MLSAKRALKTMISTGTREAIMQTVPELSRFTNSWRKYLPYDVPLWEKFYRAGAWPPTALAGNDSKYAFTLALCGDGRFQRALEIGCSMGLFTVMLAPRCEHLLAVDISQTAIDRAQIQASDFPQVTCQRLSMPLDLPVGPFDLIVCSDVLYFWRAQDLQRAIPAIANLLAPGGRFVAIHWLGRVLAISNGTVVHDLLQASMPLPYIERGEQNFLQNGSPPWRYDVFEKEIKK
jgi:SAM-dependent methyltransferase